MSSPSPASPPLSKNPRSESHEGSKVMQTHYLDLEESLSTARSELENKLQQTWSDADKCASPNIQHTFRAIRAILSTNTEIWDRCKPYLAKTSVRDESAWACFLKRRFTSVRATTDGVLFFVKATSWQNTKSFSISELCFCPSHLRIFQLEYLDCPCDGIKLIDYESLLERSLVLNSTTLQPFLLELKKHLETVQVLLGKIDAWLMEMQTVHLFLESTFGRSIPANNNLSLAFEKSKLRGSLNHEFKITEADGRARFTKFLDTIQTFP